MAYNTIKLRRGLEADRSGITPAEGELIYVTDTQKLYVGDGSTAGGVPVNLGDIELDGLSLNDDEIIALGDSDDLQMYHDSATGENKIVGDTTQTGTATANQNLLAAIDQTITGTLVDAFIYDTSKDSDGGAWRDRCQHTSWYNEDASETRGSRREFPVQALIAAESNKVTIYDLDSGTPEMWMVFTAGAGNDLSGSGGNNSVRILNGVLVFTKTYDLNEVNFVSDSGGRHSTTGLSGTYKGTIVDRDADKGWSDDGQYGDIVSRDTNDVALTVLKNSPVDASTGIQAIMWVVGTDGNGTYLASIYNPFTDAVYNIGTDSSATCESVAFGSEGSLVVTSSAGSVFVWNDASKITANGTSPDSTYTASSTPALLGTITEAIAA